MCGVTSVILRVVDTFEENQFPRIIKKSNMNVNRKHSHKMLIYAWLNRKLAESEISSKGLSARLPIVSIVGTYDIRS